MSDAVSRAMFDAMERDVQLTFSPIPGFGAVLTAEKWAGNRRGCHRTRITEEPSSLIPDATLAYAIERATREVLDFIAAERAGLGDDGE